MDSTDWEEFRRSLLADPIQDERRAPVRGRPAGDPADQGGSVWGVAILTHVIGLAVLFGVALVLGFLVMALVLWMGLTGAADDMSLTRLILLALTPFVAAVALSIAAQARFLRHAGFGPPWAAPLWAAAAGWALGSLTGLVPLPTAAQVVLTSIVEILVLVRLIRPAR
ncbi:MAG: hypothetical protein ABWX84_12145 [Nocardioides sp.]